MQNKTHQVQQIKNRNAALAWVLKTNKEYPYGFVPISTAARILGVTPNRVRDLIKYGQVRCIDDMPGGSRLDRFVPVEDLIDAPFAMARGRPGVYGPKNRAAKRKLQQAEKDYNPKDYSSLGKK
ncbi:MAG: hypothetical protein JJ974_03310 [Phycisphaerales bacterium]|nr:hypothetical protein [Phycisphaerales bacterium]